MKDHIPCENPFNTSCCQSGYRITAVDATGTGTLGRVCGAWDLGTRGDARDGDAWTLNVGTQGTLMFIA